MTIAAVDAPISPAHFAMNVSRGTWVPKPHLLVVNRKIVEVATSPVSRFLAVEMPPRHGKQVRCDEPVLTPAGWRKAGELRPGDRVFGPDGQPARVLAVTDVDEWAPKLRVRMTDGSRVDVHPNHEWTLYDRSQGRWRTVETQYLTRRKLWSAGRAVFQLPDRQALEMPEAELPIAPYLLGIWLGDGRTDHGDFCGADPDVLEVVSYVEEDGERVSWQTRHEVTGVRYCGIEKLQPRLRALGVLGGKCIPDEYLLASIAQRRLLLQGIVDSDGHVDHKGRVRVVGHDPYLLDEVKLLARSLGHKALMWSEVDDREPHELNGHEVRTAGVRYVASWTPVDGQPQGRLKRKQVACSRTSRRVGIRSVELAPNADGVCIQVDRPDGLFLVGRDLVPTHNSWLISKHTPPWYVGMFPDRRVILTSYETTFAESWGREGRNLMGEFGPQQFGVELAGTSAAVGRWNLKDHLGGVVSVGMGGALTGRGGDLIIIDDPVKGWAEAQSELLREHQWEWYGANLRTRLEPGGSIILLMCMTGDTPVLRPDGTTTPLRDIRPGDAIATYEDGRLTCSTVVNWANQGSDTLFEIRMSSGTTVRANARHPFLTVDEQGVEGWRRTGTLKPGDHILRATGGNGEASPAPSRSATSLPAARACACRTTTRLAGPLGSARPPSTPQPVGLPGSSIAMGSPSTSTTGLWLPSRGDAPSAAKCRPSGTPARIGTGSSASTTTTTPARCAACCATTATSWSATASRPSACAPPLSTWSVAPDEVVEVVPAGVEDVFDLQVDRTENFIANGLVSHNTRWHEDDLMGRLLKRAAEDPEADQWEVVRLPAIAEPEPDELVETLETWTDLIGRHAGEALWPERYPVEVLRRIEASSGPIIWESLYQQRPTAKAGGLFQTHNWRYCDTPPVGLQWVRRWDLAATEKKSGGDPDWTAGVLMARTPQTGLTFIATSRRKQAEPDEVEKFIRGTAFEDREHWGHVRVRMSQDPGQAGKALCRYYKRQVLHGFDFDFDSETGDKVARAMPLASQQGGENVVLVRGEWNKAFVEECRMFPRGAHDDQVDAAALAYQEVAGLLKRRAKLVV